MDNLAHSLVGLVTAKTGTGRSSAGTTAVCVIAANAADGDIVMGFFGGRASLLHYHRGITHSIAGTLVLGVLIPTLFWVGDRIIGRWRQREPRVRYRMLLLASLIAAATHPLLDWTNDYGVRLLLPWTNRWFYGDLVFIIDPVLWLVLGAAAFLLSSDTFAKKFGWLMLGLLVTLIVLRTTGGASQVGHPLIVRVVWLTVMLGLITIRTLGIQLKRRAALVALTLIVAYWSGLAFARHRAQTEAIGIARQIAANQGEQVIRQATLPTPVDPFRWQAVVETNRAFYRFAISSLNGGVVIVANDTANADPGLIPGVRRFEKPSGREAMLISLAARDRQAQALLEFARFPFSQVKDTNCVTETLVRFADLRYNLQSSEPGTPHGTFVVDVPVDCPEK